MVQIPVYQGEDGRIRYGKEDDSEGEDSEGSDEPPATMELLASRLEPEERRVPEIIRLESHCADMDLTNSVIEPLNTVDEVSEYVTLGSVCSAEDLAKCLHELSAVCRQTATGEEGMGVSLEVGEEVDLLEGSPEPTGMELLNLQPDHTQNESSLAVNRSSKWSMHSKAAVYCEVSFAHTSTGSNPHTSTGRKHGAQPPTHTLSTGQHLQIPISCFIQDLAAEIEAKLSGLGTWKVHSLNNNAGIGHYCPGNPQAHHVVYTVTSVYIKVIATTTSLYTQQSAMMLLFSNDRSVMLTFLQTFSGFVVQDPRLRIQRYTLGDRELFELSCVCGRWHLKSLCSSSLKSVSVC